MYLASNDVLQLPLITAEGKTPDNVRRKSRKVEETLAKLHQLHDELNTALYRFPGERPRISGPTDAAQIISLFLSSLDHEELWVIQLNTRNKVMSLTKLYVGSTNSSMVRVGEVFRQAIIENAQSIILCHNHPSGDPTPSTEDVTLTRAVVQAGKLLDIELLDHIIIADDKNVSLKEKGLGFN